jgi:hypothetical protein
MDRRELLTQEAQYNLVKWSCYSLQLRAANSSSRPVRVCMGVGQMRCTYLLGEMGLNQSDFKLGPIISPFVHLRARAIDVNRLRLVPLLNKYPDCSDRPIHNLFL